MIGLCEPKCNNDSKNFYYHSGKMSFGFYLSLRNLKGESQLLMYELRKDHVTQCVNQAWVTILSTVGTKVSKKY